MGYVCKQIFSENFLYEYKKSDGWVLVYKSFSSGITAESAPLVFAIYNKYRGVLRFFLYAKPHSPVPSNYISYSLKTLDNWSTNLLSYSQYDKVDINSRNNQVNQIHPFLTASTGTWYGSEFEIAYDPDVRNRNATDTRLTWRVNSIAINKIVLKGKTEGILKGTVAQPASSSDTFGVILNNLVKGVLLVSGKEKLNVLGLPYKYTKPLEKAFDSGIEGNAKNILNGILGGKSSGTKFSVDVRLEAEHNFEGIINASSNISSVNFVLPGTNNSEQVSGRLYLYNKVMGVFKLKQKPLVYGGNKINIAVSTRLDKKLIKPFFIDVSTV